MVAEAIRKIKAALVFKPFSIKQLQILTWWLDPSPYKDYNGIIADGAIRAGKTVPMALSFVMWAMESFDMQNFGMCGKTEGTFRRNVWLWLKPVLRVRGYKVQEVKTGTDKRITITFRGKTNYFYIFGGKDESSQDLIQGITLAGVYFDEVALMPESFVNQATGRCLTVPGHKYWFNCNPDSPTHWFYKEWLLKADVKKLFHLHFLMTDNPVLTQEEINSAKIMFVGVFFQRFILGLWVMAQGAIYRDAWSDELLCDDVDLPLGMLNNRETRRYILNDYGTVNPMVFLDVYDDGKTWWILWEYYYDSKDVKNHGVTKDNTQYADDLEGFIKNSNVSVSYIVIDPSAASWKAELRNRSLRTRTMPEQMNADNEVIEGIKMVSSMMYKKRVRIHRRCIHLKEELLSYVWDDKAIEKGMKEKPLKINDHCPDALRYGVKTLISPRRLSDM